MAGHSVAPFLSGLRACVEIENDSNIAGRAGDWQAGAIVTERLFSPALIALQPVEIAPRHAPCTVLAFKLSNHLFEPPDRIFLRLGGRDYGGAKLSFVPEHEHCHGDRINAAPVIPPVQFIDDTPEFAQFAMPLIL